VATPRPDTTRLQRLVHSYRDAAALMAAVELGLFTRVAAGADTEAAVARALDLTPTNAERLVTACVALGLLVREGEAGAARLRNAPDVARFLVEGGPAYAGPWMLFSKPDWNEWSRLSTHLRRRDTVVLGKYARGFTVEQARKYHEATYAIGMGAARRFVRQVDLSGRRQVLDLGGGSGCYCIVAAQQHPGLRAIVLDLPPVVEVAREFIASHGLADRVSAVAGDFTSDALPPGSDVMIMASNLPQYSREIIQAVIARAFAARERPACRPIGSPSSPCRRSSSSVWPYSRVVISTSAPRARRSPIRGRNTSGCALAVRSIQTLTPRRV